MDPATAADDLRRTARDVHGWSNGPHDTYGEHAHAYTKRLVCVRGSIEFRLADGTGRLLRAGDTLVVPAGTRHSAVVGPDGVECIEGKAT